MKFKKGEFVVLKPELENKDIHRIYVVENFKEPTKEEDLNLELSIFDEKPLTRKGEKSKLMGKILKGESKDFIPYM
jgi:hypothetical protein